MPEKAAYRLNLNKTVQNRHHSPSSQKRPLKLKTISVVFHPAARQPIELLRLKRNLQPFIYLCELQAVRSRHEMRRSPSRMIGRHFYGRHDDGKTASRA
jgi:hypothetical protein